MTYQPDDAPPDPVGEETVDLSGRQASPSPLDEHLRTEAHIRARSKYLITLGIVMTVLVIAAAIIWHAGHGTFMPAAYLIPLYATAGGAILLGCSEYITRHTRAQQAKALEIALQVQRGQLLLVELLDEELKQRYYAGCADFARDQLRTGTSGGPVVGRAHTNRGGEVVELRRRTSERNDPHY
jgi:hypothetical protein